MLLNQKTDFLLFTNIQVYAVYINNSSKKLKLKINKELIRILS